MNFFKVSERFQNQQVDAALDQHCNLLSKRLASLLERSFPQWFDSASQRANRSRHPNIEAFGGIPRDAHTRLIDVANLVRQTMARQAKRVATEGIGFDNLGSRLQVLVVNSANQVGLREIQFVVGTIDEDAFGVQQRA